MQHKLPHRFTERAFRVYEDVIAKIVDNWPSPTKIEPLNSIETFSQRLRDAIRSYRDHNWSSHAIDRSKFTAISENIMVRSLVNGTILVHDRTERLGAITNVVSNVAIHTNKSGGFPTIDNPTPDEVQSYLKLLGSRRLDGAEFQNVTNHESQVLIENAPNHYDVVVEAIGPHSYKVV